MNERPLRFGLAGTGYWARITHAPALASTAGIELAAVWGRNVEAAAALAGSYHCAWYDNFDDFLASVDAVAFAIPPDIQAELAVRAARAGRHLLLEKPIATTEQAADVLARAVQDAGVASVVFFTARFQADVRAWLASVAEHRWSGGTAVWLGSALAERSPFNTPWRREKGGLWDLGPHLVSLLWASLGPVTAVTADAGTGDVTHLILHHKGGASSAVAVTLCAPEAADGSDVWLWGEAGRTRAPGETDQPVGALRLALAELAANARSGQPRHDCDVLFGRAVGLILADAQRQVDARASAASVD
ncbi:MAG TPA: Gfo/Idh/MocA family oxidoreductase [Streptosporangiaceae bacterium]